MPDLYYDAFVSYRRSDGYKVARWLRRELESFRVPKSLSQTFGRKLRIYLDIAYERGTSDFYERNIKPALLASRVLLVVATPAAMRRPEGSEDWIDREIRDFTAGPNGSQVIVVRGAGEFSDPLPSDLRERFPNIEIVDLRGAGRLWFLNPVSAARLASEKLKLVAPLLDIPIEEMPKLRQEEERRQQTRIGGIIGVTVGVLVAISGMSILAVQNRNQAIRALEDSMFAAGAMAQLAVGLKESDAATAETRRLIVNRGCDLVDKFRQGAISEPQIADIVTCRIERGREHEKLKEEAQARGRFAEAIELASDRYRRNDRLDAGASHVKAREAYADYLKRNDDKDGAAAEYERLLGDARRLKQQHDGVSEFPRVEAEALGQLGDLHAAKGDRARAAAHYEDAAAAVETTIAAWESVRARPRPQTIDWLGRLYRLAAEQQVHLGGDERAIELYRKAIAARERDDIKPRNPETDFEFGLAQANLFRLERKRGAADTAGAALKAALAHIDAVERSERASRDLKQRAVRLRQWVEAQTKG